MLVLTRKLQQQIKIGDQITVTILRVKGNTVRIGVEAPREVRVVRGELPKSSVAEPEAAESTESAADLNVIPLASVERSATAAEPASGPSELPAAAHLPLRRIYNRHGKAPLKQVIAACPTLAK